LYVNSSNCIKPKKWKLPETNEIAVLDGRVILKILQLNQETQEMLIIEWMIEKKTF